MPSSSLVASLVLLFNSPSSTAIYHQKTKKKKKVFFGEIVREYKLSPKPTFFFSAVFFLYFICDIFLRYLVLFIFIGMLHCGMSFSVHNVVCTMYVPPSTLRHMVAPASARWISKNHKAHKNKVDIRAGADAKGLWSDAGKQKLRAKKNKNT